MGHRHNAALEGASVAFDPSSAPSARSKLARIREKLAGDKLLRNAAVLFGGAAAGQALSLLAAPILSRLYSPDEFGVMATFLAIAMLLAPLSTLRYELALPLTRTDEDADAMISLIGLVLTVSGALCLIGVAAAHGFDLGAVLDNLGLIAFLLPLAMMSIGAYQAAAYEATRMSRFGPLTRSKLVQGVAGPASQIGLGLLSFGTWGLAIGFIVGQIASTISLARGLLLGRSAPLARPRRVHISRLATRFRRFPQFASWAALVNAGGMGQLAILLVAALYDPAVAGFLFLAERIVARPLLMVSSSVLQAYVGDIAGQRDTSPAALRGRFRMIAGLQFGVCAIWTGAAFVLTPYLLAPVFGDAWGEGAGYIQAAALAYLAIYTLHPVYDTVQVLERPGLSAAWEIARLAGIAAVFAAAFWTGADALTALYLYAALQLVFCLFYLGLVDRLLAAWALRQGATE